jgi:hypothetical protein
MRFNIAFLGHPPLFHLRRDFILALKCGLEDLGHDVALSGMQLDTTRFNLLISAYYLSTADMRRIDASGVEFAHVNTEVIARDMLNFAPQKTDFLGGYLPSLKAGRFVWDVIMDNMPEHARYGTNAYFLRWGWLPQLEEIRHRESKEYDFFFFGLMSPRRMEIVNGLLGRGHSGLHDQENPYFVRNNRIERSRVQLNIVQREHYTHVNSFRICYLANNRCAILSEAESDPAGYLELAHVVRAPGSLGDELAHLLEGDRWKRLGEESYEKFRRTPMRECLAKLLDESFASPSRAVPATAQAAGGAP